MKNKKLFTAIVILFFIFSFFVIATHHPLKAASSDPDSEVSGKLDEILQQLEVIKEELDIIKVQSAHC